MSMRRSPLSALIVAAAVAAVIVVAIATSGAAGRQASRHGPAEQVGAHAAGATGAVGPGVAVAATNRLAVSLLPRLGARGNVVFSPYSIEAALAMVDQGAAGTTAKEIGQVLGVTGQTQLAGSNAQLGDDLAAAVAPPADADATRTAELDVANSL